MTHEPIFAYLDDDLTLHGPMTLAEAEVQCPQPDGYILRLSPLSRLGENIEELLRAHGQWPPKA